MDGKVIWGTKTYVVGPPQQEPEPVVASLAVGDVIECQLVETENFAGARPKGCPHWGYIYASDVLRIALIPIDFLNAPREAQWYGMIPEKGGEMLQSRTAALQDLVSASDSFYASTDVDLIYFVFPLEAEATYGAFTDKQLRQFNSDEGTFATSVYGEMGGSYGNPNPRSVWGHLVREICTFRDLFTTQRMPWAIALSE